MKIVESHGLLTPQQAADYLGIKLSSIYSLTMKKAIIFAKIGRLIRFRIADLDKWIESRIQGEA